MVTLLLQCVYRESYNQILATQNVDRKSVRWWKALFFHIIDTAVVNSFLFREHRFQFLHSKALKRTADKRPLP